MFILSFKSVFKWDIDVYIVDTGVNLEILFNRLIGFNFFS